MSHFEVEQKRPLTSGEYHDQIAPRLTEMGFTYHATLVQDDIFLPGMKPDEMLRLRKENGQYQLTTKFSVVAAGCLTRKEESVPLHPVAAKMLLSGAHAQLSATTKPKPLPSLQKHRVEYQGKRDGKDVTVSVDLVNGLDEKDSPYWFEIEIICAQEDQVPAAIETIEALSREILGEDRPPVQDSYQKMLMKSLSQKP